MGQKSRHQFCIYKRAKFYIKQEITRTWQNEKIDRICLGGVILPLAFLLSQGLLASGQPSYPPLWSYETGGIVGGVCISPDGSYIAVGSDVSKVYLFDSSGRILWSQKTENIVFSVSISYDESYVAAGSGDHKVYLFDRPGNLLWSYETEDVVGSVSISTDGNYVARVHTITWSTYSRGLETSSGPIRQEEMPDFLSHLMEYT